MACPTMPASFSHENRAVGTSTDNRLIAGALDTKRLGETITVCPDYLPPQVATNTGYPRLKDK